MASRRLDHLATLLFVSPESRLMDPLGVRLAHNAGLALQYPGAKLQYAVDVALVLHLSER